MLDKAEGYRVLHEEVANRHQGILFYCEHDCGTLKEVWEHRGFDCAECDLLRDRESRIGP